VPTEQRDGERYTYRADYQADRDAHADNAKCVGKVVCLWIRQKEICCDYEADRDAEQPAEGGEAEPIEPSTNAMNNTHLLASTPNRCTPSERWHRRT
jgi:hypothetical protein